MNILHRPAYERTPLAEKLASLSPQTRDVPEARAVAVEPPAPEPQREAPGVTALIGSTVRTTIADLRASGDLKPQETDRNRLNEIASLVRSLTYGEMIELAEGLWKRKPEGEITEAMLPGMLHQWSGRL